MSGEDRASQGLLARLCGMATPWKLAARMLRGAGPLAACELDERLKRDIGYSGRAAEDPRTAHFRKLMQRGQPLP